MNIFSLVLFKRDNRITFDLKMKGFHIHSKSFISVQMFFFSSQKNSFIELSKNRPQSLITQLNLNMITMPNRFSGLI